MREGEKERGVMIPGKKEDIKDIKLKSMLFSSFMKSWSKRGPDINFTRKINK